ncbi:hypothetical protein Syun_008287 [Stephania yunnanensis]|uniref:Essential protein Yae1 N-terminal domain-containing protein n=1 Tax=Stephania yunnanensis TaxID=152371 RepID=A0AAP0PME0_9MAGN
MEPNQCPNQPIYSDSDFLGPTVDLDETHIQEGYRDGFNDALQSKNQEERESGLKLGFQVGEELGFYRGCIDVWNSALEIDPNCLSSRVKKNIKLMGELIDEYPVLDAKIVDVMDQLRLKFKMISASLGLKLEYDGYPKSSEEQGLDF